MRELESTFDESLFLGPNVLEVAKLVRKSRRSDINGPERNQKYYRKVQCVI